MSKYFRYLVICAFAFGILAMGCSKKTTAVPTESKVSKAEMEASPRAPASNADNRFLEMAKEIGLNAIQTEKFLSISKDFADQRKALMQNMGDRSAMRIKMQDLRKSNNQKMQNLMDASQYAKYLSLLESSRPKRGQAPRPNRPEPGAGG